MTDRLTEPLDDFKERELEIINLMANGLSNQEIADQLFITKGTVRWYNKQIYSKLGTSRRTEAIALAREMGLIGDDDQSGEISPQHIVHTPPIPTGPFVGRSTEIHDLIALLDKPEVRLISIIGLGGMGKSRLSLEVANQVKHSYEHGAVFVDLTAIRNPHDIASFINKSLNLTAESAQSPTEILFNYCREKALLFIFDNFEHVLEGMQLLTDLLEVAPDIKIIVTSRESLNLRIETAFYLPPITEHSAQLFAEVATMMYPRFKLDESETESVNRITELVGGSPLALILAASWVDTLSVDEIVEEIQLSLDFLSADMGDMPERQQSIRAVFDPTWKRLSPDEQKAFMWASVFRGGFTHKLFRKMTGASVKVLQTLVNRSLIHHGYERRYDMHPLLRQYAREKLEETGELAPAKNTHLSVFADYAQANKTDKAGNDYLESLEMLTVEQDNFRAALDWSFSGHDTEIGLELVIILSAHWVNTSRIPEAIRYLERAQTYHQDARLYMQLGFCQYRMGQIDDAKESIHRAIELAEDAQIIDVLANSYRILAFLGEQERPIEETQHLLEKALTYAMQSQVPQVIASCHDSLGNFLSLQGISSVVVFDHLEKELAIWESLGDLQGISRVNYNMGLEYYAIGDKRQARELCERSLALKRQIGDRAGIARRLSTLAFWDFLDEEFEKAEHAFTESIEVIAELGEQFRLQSVLGSQGIMYMIMGAFDKSEQCLERSLELAFEIKSLIHIEYAHSSLAMLFLIQGRIENATSHVQQAIEACSKNTFDSWTAVTAYANYLWYRGEYDSCVPLVAFLHQMLEHSERSQLINNKYFLQPLIYRVKNHVDQKTWNQALEDASETTFEHVLDEIVQRVSMWDES